ncbi:hypothetical protein [Anaerolactibacter massiliensis]|uniref:hypothetical protein n=1 Tax=Anaerolactibacter massiliensis TaxID=2044573 RepID=UPI00107F9546|nr:hypothetical protein [Anaerolactibacter massiliensis]
MTLRNFDWDAYRQEVKNMRGPIPMEEFPLLKCNVDYRGMIAYARAHGKHVPDLTDDEKAMFVEGGKTHLHEPGGWL